MRPGRRGRGVGQPRGGHDPGGHAGAVSHLQPGQARLAEAVGAVVAVAGGDADRALVAFHPGGDRGHGAGRIGGLRIGVVGLAQRGVRELLPAQQVLLARLAAALALEDAGGSHGGQAHAVAEEQDHVLRPARHGAAAGGARRAAAIPPVGRFAAGMGHRRHLDGDRLRVPGVCGRWGGAGGQQGQGAVQRTVAAGRRTA